VVVTDLAVHRFDDSGQMVVESLHPGVTPDALRDSMAWEPRWADAVATTEPPSMEELRLIREELDPAGVYTKPSTAASAR
jgi:glutaconate CoA-transferase subunit B